MLRIRLTRMGATKKPFYRVVVAEKKRAREGRFVELLGYYNPRANPVQVHVNVDRINYWISKGAKPSDTVHSLIKWAQTPKPEPENQA